MFARLLLGPIQRLGGKISDERRMLRQQRFQFSKKRRHFGIFHGRCPLAQLPDPLVDRVEFQLVRVVSKRPYGQYSDFCSLGDAEVGARGRANEWRGFSRFLHTKSHRLVLLARSDA